MSQRDGRRRVQARTFAVVCGVAIGLSLLAAWRGGYAEAGLWGIFALASGASFVAVRRGGLPAPVKPGSLSTLTRQPGFWQIGLLLLGFSAGTVFLVLAGLGVVRSRHPFLRPLAFVSAAAGGWLVWKGLTWNLRRMWRRDD